MTGVTLASTDDLVRLAKLATRAINGREDAEQRPDVSALAFDAWSAERDFQVACSPRVIRDLIDASLALVPR